MTSIDIDMVEFFNGATDMVDYLHTFPTVNFVINAAFILGGVLLALIIYWSVTSGSDD